MPNRKRGSFHASDSGSTIQIGTHKDGRRTHTLTTDGNIVRNANPGSSRNSVCARLRDGHDVIFPTNPNHIASRKLTVKTFRKATAHEHDKQALLTVDLSPSSPSAHIPWRNQRLVKRIWRLAVPVTKLTALDSGGCSRSGYKMPHSSITAAPCSCSKQPVYMHTISTRENPTIRRSDGDMIHAP
jgi:hypothetical protein